MLKVWGIKLKRIFKLLFTSIYQFDSPVCFLNEDDYDLSGNWKKVEPEIEEEMGDWEAPTSQYDVLTRSLLDLVLGEHSEKLINVDRNEEEFQGEMLRGLNGWTRDVLTVLHYEFYNVTWHRDHRLIDFNTLRGILHLFGIYPDQNRLDAAYEQHKRKMDGLINFSQFLQILYWCDEPRPDGTLGATAEAIRIQGLNYRIASTLDPAGLVEYGLL